jgi:hypothetical protein
MNRPRPTIAILETIGDTPRTRYNQFAELANSIGVTVLRPQQGAGVEGIQHAWAQATELLKTADSFLVSGLGIEDVPHIQQIFHERINAGARAIIVSSTFDSEELARTKAFLGRYYLEPTTLKIVAADGGRIAVTFSRRAGSLVAPEFFNGVETLTVASPYAIRYGAESWPLVQGYDDHWPVEMMTDYEPGDWNARELVSLAIWRGSASGPRGAVVLDCSAGVVADPAEVMSGRVFGIEHNYIFARNLIGFLTDANPTDRPPSARDLFERIEINTCDFCVGVLKTLGSDWWNRVPEKVRNSVQNRKSKEHSRLQPHALLLFSDYVTIFEANLDIFEAPFSSRRLEVKTIKSCFRALNKIRRPFAHPTNAYVSSYETTPEEYRLLRDVDAFMIELVKPYVGHGKGG